MKVHVDLADDFSKGASITLEEEITDSYPPALKPAIEENITFLLRVFGGIALAVIVDARIDHSRGDRKPVMDDVVQVLKDFSLRQIRGNTA